jgi:hypothetical protein
VRIGLGFTVRDMVRVRERVRLRVRERFRDRVSCANIFTENSQNTCEFP